MIPYPDEAKINDRIIYDTHAHYDDECFKDNLDVLLRQQKNSGVYSVISCAVDYKSSLDTIKLANRYDFVYAAIGTHPENLTGNDDFSYLYQLSNNKKCVAIGEIGLDYHYDISNKSAQIDAFKKQIIIANELDLPVIVHDRDAHSDTMNVLKELKPKGVLHCFSGSEEMAKEILKLGMYIGVGGVITFKNAKKLPDIVKNLPEDRILIETDCPYLSPEPYRGKICHSGLIPFTAEKIAQLRNTTRDDVLQATCRNAKELFGVL